MIRSTLTILAATLFVAAAATAAAQQPDHPKGAIVYQVEHPIPGEVQPDVDLCLIDPTTGRDFALTSARAGRFDLEPDWSPDGRVVGFSRSAYGERGSERLRVIDSRGTTERALAGGRGANPSWSPNATEVAFVNAGIIVAPARGGATRRLVPPSLGGVGGPAWSPDGVTIAYVVQPLAIRLIQTDGSRDRELVRGGTTPAWSPDARRIAFARGDGRGNIHIWTVAVDGSSAVQVTRGAVNDLSPSWSPDGGWLSFVRQPSRGGQSDIYRVRASGANLTNVTRSPLQEAAPDWGPQSTQVPVGASVRPCTVTGTPGRDRLRGSERGDSIYGRGGADVIHARAGPDIVDGGSGDDLIDAGSGTDVVGGGSGADHIATGLNDDRIFARDKRRDAISCGGGRDAVVADRVDHIDRDCEKVRRR